VCTFCDIAAGRLAAEVVYEDDHTLAFLDHRPLFEGHTLVITRAHHETLPELPVELVGPFFSAVRRLSAAVVEAFGAHGSFVALNNVVSQSVPHLHCHVVPRRRKDGLRGFFWPRTRYADAAHMARAAQALRAALERLPA
jgi:histidine triad (HIT) family protein